MNRHFHKGILVGNTLHRRIMGAEHSHHGVNNYSWIPSSVNGPLPHNAVRAGSDVGGEPIFIGRTFHNGDQVPVKVIPRSRSAYLSYGGVEVAVHNYEILTGDGFTWVTCSNGNIPPNAVSTGKQRDGEILFVGRSYYQGSMCPGKVQRTHGCLYIPFAGVEHRVTQYEVLVAPRRSASGRWVRAGRRHGPPIDAVVAGHDVDNSNLYVGRANHDGHLLPAKVGRNAAYVSFGGREICKTDYEILCGGRHVWVRCSTGAPVPYGAVLIGSGDPVYVGRGYHNGRLTPGKIHVSHGVLNIPYEGIEYSYRDYEFLVEQ